MRAAAWLATRELRARWRRVVLAGAGIAALAAAATAMELLARAREDAVSVRIDLIGPALTVVPPGTTAGALARAELGDRVLPAATRARVAAALGSELRRAEPRLILKRNIGRLPTTVIGVEGATGGALVGAELASRLGNAAVVEIDGIPVPVDGVRPETGGIEDVAITLPLATAAALAGAGAGINALDLYLASAVDAGIAERRLAVTGLDAAIVRHDRGEVATRELPGSLARHRHVAYALFALAAALCLIIVAHLDASERRIEIATLVAIGAGRASIVGALVGRSMVVAAVGAAVGVATGFVVAVAQDPSTLGALVRHPGVLLLPIIASGALAGVAAAPTAFVAAVRDPVPSLQEL